jgi:hemolysin D
MSPLNWLSGKDDAHEFKPLLAEIEADPGSPLGPLTLWLVIALFAFFLFWAIFGQVDVVVSARGKVIPAGEVKVLQPLTGGVVSRILTAEGAFVKKGQALVVIDPSTTQPSLKSNQQTLEHMQLEQARLEASVAQGSFNTDHSETQGRLYQASQEALRKQLGAKEKQLNTLEAQIQGKQVDVRHTEDTLIINRDKLARLEAVKDIIPKDEYQKGQADVLADTDKLKTLSHDLEQLRFQQQQTREEMAYIQANYESTALNELSEKEKQMMQLHATIEEAAFRNARQTLTSPVDGYVHELFVHTVGGVVTSAQKVISVVPVRTPLMIRTTVFNKDIGFVKEGMPVAIKVDTYDFQKYGTLKGVVSHIDKDSKDDPKLGPVYTVEVKPRENQLLVDGHWQALSTGLSVSAEIKTGKRQIIEFFIYPLVKHLNEGMSVR